MKLKPAKTLTALHSMVARMPSDAFASASKARRTYNVDGPSGKWDAEVVDYVLSEISRYLKEADLSEHERADLHWIKGLNLWSIGHFDEAAADIERSLEGTLFTGSSRKRAERTLELIRGKQSPLAALDDEF